MTTQRSGRIAVFGASGAIGTALCQQLTRKGWQVLAFSRRGSAPDPASEGGLPCLGWDAHPAPETRDALAAAPVDAVVWAQGQNCRDSILDFDEATHTALYEANVLYILRTLRQLLDNSWLSPRARLCVVSSVWQDVARPDKLSYCVSKSALRGLVQSVSVDLGPRGVLINAVLPGAIDTPMTRAQLSREQIDQLCSMTPTGQLPNLADVCETVAFLCSPSNTSVTGQFVAVDGGFSHAKVL